MESKKNNIQLTKREEQIIYGTLLGDGSIGIQPKGKTPRIQIRHSIVQRHWFFWKKKELHRLCSEKAVHLQKPDGFSKRCKLHLQTLSKPCLNSVYTNTRSKEGKKTPTKHWLKHITPLSLMVWWVDDGSLISKGRRKGRWNVQGFGKKGCNFLANFLARKFKIKTTVASYYQTYAGKRKRYYYLYIQPGPLKRLLLLMLPHVPCRQVLYKFFLVYKDKQLQQHWITEMKKIVPQFSNEIDELLKRYS